MEKYYQVKFFFFKYCQNHKKKDTIIQKTLLFNEDMSGWGERKKLLRKFKFIFLLIFGFKIFNFILESMNRLVDTNMPGNLSLINRTHCISHAEWTVSFFIKANLIFIITFYLCCLHLFRFKKFKFKMLVT